MLRQRLVPCAYPRPGTATGSAGRGNIRAGSIARNNGVPRDPSSLTDDVSCCLTRLYAVLLDHRPRPPTDLGNLARGPDGKSPLQVLDQVPDSLPVLFFGARHAAKAADVFGVAIGFGDGDRPLIV